MHEWWQRTQRVAAISAVLARMSERFDPDFAALVGLLHAIAEPVVLGYADRHRDLADPVALENVVHDNRGELGRMLTTAWGLPRAVCEAATLCNHWEYDHQGTADYTDITLVAQWHATLGAAGRRRRPASDRIPAFGRLGLEDASPEVSLRIIEAADSALERSERLLDPPLGDATAD
jgi:HD-like signal output (HDOD) protein